MQLVGEIESIIETVNSTSDLEQLNCIEEVMNGMQPILMEYRKFKKKSDSTRELIF